MIDNRSATEYPTHDRKSVLEADMQHLRAINDKEKLERRAAILAAAMVLFQTASFDAVNMQAVADRAGIAKGTTYLYFKSKEEMFLALLSDELARWLRALRDQLSSLEDAQLPQEERIHAFSTRVGQSLKGQERFTRLIPIVQAILEQNIEPTAALSYKRRLRMRFMTAGLQIEDVLPFLKKGEGAELLLTIYMMLIGLQGMAEPAPAIAQALKEPDMVLFRVETVTMLVTFLNRYLTGMAGGL